MWTAQRGRQTQREESSPARIGGVTLAQIPLGVYVDGERRNLPLYTPGGYSWKPNVGDSVLVVKTEDGSCVVGSTQNATDLLAGEVKISGDSSEIHLTTEGEISLSGTIIVNGTELNQLIAQLVTQQLTGT